MIQDFDYSRIVTPLLGWYDENKRDLPWRHDITPYRVWVSEIMLQQTRVETVKPYFARFLAELPDIPALAECPEDKLLKLWEGLGYYSRVRNMQSAARSIMAEHGGSFPEDHEVILTLKGIGRYTAAAISSIAFRQPVPAVDGNVFRVALRLAADDSDITKASTRTALEQALAPIIPADRARDFTPALMDLGAGVCTPNGEPHCEACPLAELCMAREEQLWRRLPVKKKAPRRRVEDRTVLIIRDGLRVLLHKRPPRGLLAGLYELPNVPGTLTENEAFAYAEALGLEPLRIETLDPAVHVFSHVEWHMTGYLLRIAAQETNDADDADDAAPAEAGAGYLFAQEDEYPIPSAFNAYRSALFTDVSEVVPEDVPEEVPVDVPEDSPEETPVEVPVEVPEGV